MNKLSIRKRSIYSRFGKSVATLFHIDLLGTILLTSVNKLSIRKRSIYSRFGKSVATLFHNDLLGTRMEINMVRYEGKSVITTTINGEVQQLLVRPSDLLLDVLREQLGLTAAKAGCKNGDCGACTVMVDGWPAKSCLMLAVEAEGHVILTVEGLGGTAAIQKAFVDTNAFQCGYCTSGFLMVCHALHTQYPKLPEEYEIEEWLQSNLCRCTGYGEIRKAVHKMYEYSDG